MEYACASLTGYDSYGANQNTVLLATAGSTFISNDDDAYCRPGTLEPSTDEVEFSNAYLPANPFYYPDRASLLDAINKCSPDILLLHSRFLGENAADIENAAAGSSSQVSDTVLLTVAGSYGDSGMKSAKSFLSQEGPNRKKLFSTNKNYNAHKLSKELIRIPDHSTVGQGTHCSAMHIGLSNDTILPPLVHTLILRALSPGDERVFDYLYDRF